MGDSVVGGVGRDGDGDGGDGRNLGEWFECET